MRRSSQTNRFSIWCRCIRRILCLIACLPIIGYAKPTLSVTMHALEPYVIAKDNQPSSGFVVDIFNRMAKLTGYQRKPQLLTFRQGLKDLRRQPTADWDLDHRAHLIVVKTQARSTEFKWVGPILFDGVLFYQRADDERIFKQFADIKRQNAICTIERGVAETERFRAMSIPFYDVDSQQKALQLVFSQQHRFDCTHIALMNTDAILKKAGLTSTDIKRMQVPHFINPIYMAFSKSTPDKLVNQWQQALNQLDQSGERLAIISRYVPAYTESLENALRSTLVQQN